MDIRIVKEILNDIIYLRDRYFSNEMDFSIIEYVEYREFKYRMRDLTRSIIEHLINYIEQDEIEEMEILEEECRENSVL